MVTKGKKNGEYRFSYKPASNKVTKVSVAGSFNNWIPRAMTRQKTGEFAVSVPLAAGYYEYKFLADGQWVEDVENEAYAFNPYGTVNSVLKAE